MKKLTVPLVALLILGLVFGSVGCGERQLSGDLAGGPVKSISPAPQASGVAADATVAIQFREPIWVLPSASTPDKESVQVKQSSELANRFKIVNATTGEVVDGTVTLEGNTKLTFVLPPGAKWQPHTTYWLMATSRDSFEGAYSEGAVGSLFLSAFTTQLLDEDQLPVKHLFPGGLPTLLNDIAFDVDTSQSLSFAELKSEIETAQNKADAANAQVTGDCTDIKVFPKQDSTKKQGSGEEANTWELKSCGGKFVSKFHFWPNVINLTEVYYAEDSHSLFNDILSQLLERASNKAQLKSDLTSQVARGDRIFSACDFISSVVYGFKTYSEVYYGLLINLDNPDQTGARRPYAREILVHDYVADGLPMLHDPHTEKLAAIFATPATIPIGEAWDLCLRGNLKKTKYNAIIVDKLAEAPDAEFYIERVHLTCYCGFHDLDISVPDVPWKPWKPWNPDPKPLFDPMPNPNLYKNPPPPNSKPRQGEPPVNPLPLPGEPFPLPPKDTIGLPSEKPKPSQGEGAEVKPESKCSDAKDVASELARVKSKFKDENEKWRQDAKLFNEKFGYYGWWPEDSQNIRFNDPCLQCLFEKHRGKAEPLLKEISKKSDEIGNLWDEGRKKRENMPLLLQVLACRANLWAEMLYVGGDWRKVTKSCMAFAPAPSPGIAMVGIEPQVDFQREVARVLMRKENNTWQEAVKSALAAKNAEAEGLSSKADWSMIWEQYAACLRGLFTEQLEIFLKKVEGFEGVSDTELDNMIEVMFNDASASSLTETQKDDYARIQKELEELRGRMDGKGKELAGLHKQLEKIRSEFATKAIKCCYKESLENYWRTLQLGELLERYLEWCKNPDQNVEWGFKEEDKKKGEARLCLILCKLRQDKEFAGSKVGGFTGLMSYIEKVIKLGETFKWCNCTDVKEKPYDPECEDCTKTRPPTPSTPPSTGVPLSPPITPTPPVTPTSKEILRSEVNAMAESVRDKSGCRSTLTISYGGQDVTAGKYLVTKVVLKVNGQVWHDSGTVSTVHYQNTVSKQVGCGQTFNIEVTVTNQIGRTVTATHSITTPVP